MNKYKKIFIIDDDLIFVFLLKKILTKISCVDNILHFINGKDAFEALKTLNENREILPELIFLDINMPVVDGWQFLDLVEQQAFETKLSIYMVSSTISLTEIDKINSNEYIKGFLPKPIEHEKLLKVLN